MATKSDKETIILSSANDQLADRTGANKPSSKSRQLEEDDDILVDELPLRAGQKNITATSADEDDDDATEDEIEEDKWEKGEEEEDNWDPDFDEFDLPKSTGKKAIGGKKSKDEEDDDFKVDDDFKDLFNDSSSGFDDNDDDF